jgi:hypothetical protein
MPKEKAPTQMGSLEISSAHVWGIIKTEMMDEVTQFYNMNQQDLHFLNQALVTLIQKNQMIKG